MKFYYIFWFLVACSLAISFTNAIGVFDTDYMTAPEGSTYTLTNVSGSLNNTMPQDDVSMAIGGFFAMVGFVKDLAVNSFLIYDTMVDIFMVPEPIAMILQTIVAISWAVFIMQIISRFAWGGLEG